MRSYIQWSHRTSPSRSLKFIETLPLKRLLVEYVHTGASRTFKTLLGIFLLVVRCPPHCKHLSSLVGNLSRREAFEAKHRYLLSCCRYTSMMIFCSLAAGISCITRELCSQLQMRLENILASLC